MEGGKVYRVVKRNKVKMHTNRKKVHMAVGKKYRTKKII